MNLYFLNAEVIDLAAYRANKLASGSPLPGRGTASTSPGGCYANPNRPASFSPPRLAGPWDGDAA